MTPNESLWTTKLHARLHDPAEKALVLLRDPAGHEGGTCRALARLMGWETGSTTTHFDPDNAQVLHCTVFKDGLLRETYDTVRRADWWAAAADRPQFPMQELPVTDRQGQTVILRVAPGSQVRWANAPVLIHPLTGEQLDLGRLGGLTDTEIGDIKARSFQHFATLVQKDAEGNIIHNAKGRAMLDWGNIFATITRLIGKLIAVYYVRNKK